MKWLGIFIQGGSSKIRAKVIQDLKEKYNENKMNLAVFTHKDLTQESTAMLSVVRKQLYECCIFDMNFRHPRYDNRARILAYELPNYGYKVMILTIRTHFNDTVPDNSTYADYRLTSYYNEPIVEQIIEMTKGDDEHKTIPRRYAKNLRGKTAKISRRTHLFIPDEVFKRLYEMWGEFGCSQEENLLQEGEWTSDWSDRY